MKCFKTIKDVTIKMETEKKCFRKVFLTTVNYTETNVEMWGTQAR